MTKLVLAEKPAAAARSISHSRPWITEADQQAVSQVLETGMLASGRLVRKFEQEVANYCDLLACKFVPTGRFAMFQALQLVGVKPGDEVILPTYVCPSMLAAVRACGAVPVLCDVGADWCLRAEDALARITHRTRAIIVAHMFGITADVEPLIASAVPVIEDCAHAFGGTTQSGRPVGSLGAAAIYSFGPTKPLTAGTGGFVGTATPELAEMLLRMSPSDWPMASAPVTDLQAALGLSQMARQEEVLRRRRAIADRYFDQLAACDVVLPRSVSGRSIFYRFPLRAERPFETLMNAFATRGVAVRQGVDSLLHRQEGLNPAGFSGAEACFASTVSIPLYPSLAEADVSAVIAAAHEVLGERHATI